MCRTYVIIQIVIRTPISDYFSSRKTDRSSLPLMSTTATENTDAPQTGSIMSKGAAAPQAARTAATVDGINWIDAVFKVISVSTLSGLSLIHIYPAAIVRYRGRARATVIL